MNKSLALAHYAATRLEPLLARAVVVGHPATYTLTITLSGAQTLTISARHGIHTAGETVDDMPSIDRLTARFESTIEDLETTHQLTRTGK